MPRAADHRSSRPGKRANYSHATHRLREIERIIRDRHGTVPDTDDADTYIMSAALCLRQIAIDRGCAPTPEHITGQIEFWCKQWAPDYREIPALVARVCKSKRNGIGKADQIAKKLRLSDADRTRLGIRTIGSYDVDKRAREKRRAARKRDRDRENARLKRGAKGAMPRDQWLASRLSQIKPWAELGISRRTYERRRKAVASPSPIPILPADDEPATRKGKAKGARPPSTPGTGLSRPAQRWDDLGRKVQ
jgi:hypothetical protein